jgi:RNA polymerase-binding transcription factor DksA
LCNPAQNRGTHLAKKGISVWLFSSLTFIATLHLIDAISALVFNNEIKLLKLYPFINEKLQTITPTAYFWATAAATFILWGITCTIAFTNPVEAFLNNILSDAKTQGAVETQLLEEKSEVLDAMYETIEADNQTLAQVKDLMCNVRADVKEIQPLKEAIEKTRSELNNLKKEIKKVEEKTQFPNICPACGKPLLPEFKMCPYCGERIKLTDKIIPLEKYR